MPSLCPRDTQLPQVAAVSSIYSTDSGEHVQGAGGITRETRWSMVTQEDSWEWGGKGTFIFKEMGQIMFNLS